MGIFDFFKSKTEKVETPDELKHLISQDDFNSILTFATTHLTDKGHRNIYFADGLLLYETLEEGGTRNQTNFLNLVKSVLCEEKKDWQVKTVEYLDNLSKDKELENEILLDFGKAKEYLTLRLQPITNYQDEPYKSHVEKLVYKVDIPEIYTLLALDLPNRFHILTIDEIHVWGIDRDNLFEIAHNNLRDKIEDIQAQQLLLARAFSSCQLINCTYYFVFNELTTSYKLALAAEWRKTTQLQNTQRKQSA